MKSWTTIGFILLVGTACDSPNSDSVAWNGTTAALAVSNYTHEGPKVSAEGEIGGVVFRLDHERLNTSSRLMIESGETRLTFERGMNGEDMYILEQSDLGNHTVRVQELEGSRRQAEMSLLRYMRDYPGESAPRRELDERGVGLWLAMLPEVIAQLGEMGLTSSEISSLAETTTGAYLTMMVNEREALWAGGTVGGCEISHGGTECSCPAVTCFAGSTPTGIGQCTIFATCTKANGEVEIGPVSELNGEYTNCTTYGNCVCGATCQQCRSDVGTADAGIAEQPIGG
ncbi:MAG: hypothetical protein AAF449_09860 [Myxococcota bacterium]